MSSFDCLRQAPTRTTACGFVMSGLLLVGCGSEAPKGPPRVPLAGTVTFDGQPLGGADITFFNQDDEVGMITSAEGNYKIPIGARPGSYKVTVSKLKGLENIPEGVAVAPSPGENPEMIPPQFSSRSLTKLTYTVPDEGTETANFDLSTK
jgi:hypothetical protein